MKLLIDERLKHRLIGLGVVVAIAVIFLPALMKESNYRLDKVAAVSVHLPQKPSSPLVMIPDKKMMFEAVKVAHVELTPVKIEPELAPVVKAEPVRIAEQNNKLLTLAKTEVAVVAAPKKQLVVAKKAVLKQKLAKQPFYAVQLASFAQQSNASSLVQQLREKGYKATYTKSRDNSLYKVIVGELNHKEKAENLQKILASKMQLNGFIVKTGVS